MKKTLLSVLMTFSLVSAQAAVFQYSVTLDGPTEPSPSEGTGSGTVSYDDVLHTLQVQVTFSGLTNTGGTTVSHIHAATAAPFTGTAIVATPTPTFPGFPAGVTSGSYSNTLDLTLASSWNDAFITANGGTPAGAEAALFTAMNESRAYWNIHSTQFGPGEIRGFTVLVPEPSILALGGVGAVGMLIAVRRRFGRR